MISSTTPIDAWLMKPDGAGPFPAVVLLHGCGGLYSEKTGDLTARHRDWAERFVAAGFVVLLPDSLSARGFHEICSMSPQPVHPNNERFDDAWAALAFVESLPEVSPERVALLGWSHGGSTVLATIAARPKHLSLVEARDPAAAIAFYPSCKSMLRHVDTWLPTKAPLHVLIGGDDDWASAADCERLRDEAAARGVAIDLVVYPGAVHDFDDPKTKVHVRKNVGSTPTHTATVGQDPAARADAIARVLRILADVASATPPPS